MFDSACATAVGIRGQLVEVSFHYHIVRSLGSTTGTFTSWAISGAPEFILTQYSYVIQSSSELAI